MTTSDAPRVVLYLRQSHERPGEDERTSLSIRSQEDTGRRWAASRGGVVVGVVIDHDLRGADPERPGIRRLLATVRSERIDALWLLSLSRLARDLILQLVLCREIERAGVGTIWTDVEGEVNDPFIRGIHGLMNEQTIRQQSAHLKAAFARRARDGGFPVGPTPIAYKRPHRITVHRANGTHYERETGEPVVDPEGAAFVRSLFARFAAGASLHQLAAELAAQGPGPRGGTWTRTTVKRILQSPIYAGDIVHRGEVVAHDDKWRVVDRDLWDRVQARLRRVVVVRNGERRQAHWLAGLVVHACGNRMYWQPYTTGNPTGANGMFRCRTDGEPTKCPHGRRLIGGDVLARVVRALLARDLAHLPTPANALQLAQERSGGPDGLRTRARIDRALRDAQARWTRNHERFSAGKLPPAVMDAEDALLDQAVRAHADAIAALPQPPDPARLTAAHAALTRLADLLPVMTEPELRRTVETLGVVAVGPDGARIAYVPEAADLVPEPATIQAPLGGRGFRR